jgi:hypothetical protein
MKIQLNSQKIPLYSSSYILPTYAITVRLRNAEMFFLLTKKKCSDCMFMWSGVLFAFYCLSLFIFTIKKKS